MSQSVWVAIATCHRLQQTTLISPSYGDYKPKIKVKTAIFLLYPQVGERETLRLFLFL